MDSGRPRGRCRLPITWLKAGMILIGALLIVGCESEASITELGHASPTRSALFAPVTTVPATSVAEPAGDQAPASTPRATATKRPASAPRWVDVPVYEDGLVAGWSLEASEGMRYVDQDTTHAHSGTRSIAMTPTQNYGRLFLTVTPKGQLDFLRDDVFSVRMWLCGTGDGIGPDDLAITIVGSNASPHWTKNDDSVVIDTHRFFSETRLSLLGVKQLVPAGQWVEVEVRLDRLPYDPDYTYLTGIYVKNDRGFMHTVYIDDIYLVMVGAESK